MKADLVVLGVPGVDPHQNTILETTWRRHFDAASGYDMTVLPSGSVVIIGREKAVVVGLDSCAFVSVSREDAQRFVELLTSAQAVVEYSGRRVEYSAETYEQLARVREESAVGTPDALRAADAMFRYEPSADEELPVPPEDVVPDLPSVHDDQETEPAAAGRLVDEEARSAEESARKAQLEEAKATRAQARMNRSTYGKA